MWISKPEGFFSITKAPDGSFEICAPTLRSLAELLRAAGITGTLRHTSAGEKFWGVSVESGHLKAVFSVLSAPVRDGKSFEPAHPAARARELEELLLSMMPHHHESVCRPAGRTGDF